MGKSGQKIEDGPRPEIGKKWFKNVDKRSVVISYCFTSFGPFFPHLGPWASFDLLSSFSHFGFSARFPFYARRTDSQFEGGSELIDPHPFPWKTPR